MAELQENTVQQTLCIPLWGRMIAAEKYPDLFPDRDAGRIVGELGVDLSDKKLYRFQYMWMNCLLRQYNLAWEIERYLKDHPQAAVVELGAGLSCLRREMGNDTNPWYCLDMENVIALRQRHIPLGAHERNVVCDLNDFAWFDEIDFRPEDGAVFTAGGLFYYFEKEQVRRLLCAMAERFPGGAIAFDAVNALGLKGVNAEVKLAGNETKSFFSLERPGEELESWSERIVNVAEKDYFDGYLKGGWRKTAATRLFIWVCRTFHMCFMLHAEFRA
ncbi:MAG: class I SAM-dependent methyltransferase [Oscillospiraceae bacterium]|nr:class I SAM-dependent methyltransferase [Oscillospiraceae bacterium]